MDQKLNPVVLLLTSEYPPFDKGGEGVQSADLARGLVRAGAEVHVISFTAEKSQDMMQDGVNIHFRAPSQTQGVQFDGELITQIDAYTQQVAQEVGDLIAAGDFTPDVIHCQGRLVFPMGRQLRKRFGIPVVGSVHLLHEPIDRWFGVEPHPEDVFRESEYVTGLDLVLAVSQSMAGIVKTTFDLPDSKVRVVYNGVDTKLFRRNMLPSATRAKLRSTMAKPEEKLVLFAGRLDPIKGLEALISSAAKVVDAHPQARYLIAGEASSRAADRQVKELLAAHPQLEGRIKLLGRISRKQLAMLYQVVDVALVTSLYESFCYAVVEAMACGVPVVSTAAGAIPEIIQHGAQGLLIPLPRNEAGRFEINVDSLAQAQLELLEDPQRAATLGDAGYRHVLETFSLDNMVQGTLDFYRSALRTPVLS